MGLTTGQSQDAGIVHASGYRPAFGIETAEWKSSDGTSVEIRSQGATGTCTSRPTRVTALATTPGARIRCRLFFWRRAAVRRNAQRRAPA